MKLYAREPVIFAENFQAMIQWYTQILQFNISQLIEGEYHYCNLENEAGVKLGIAPADEMGVELGNRASNSVVLQFQVADLPKFFEYLSNQNVEISFGPALDKKDNFWFGGIQDLEGNPIWVVDENCP